MIGVILSIGLGVLLGLAFDHVGIGLHPRRRPKR